MPPDCRPANHSRFAARVLVALGAGLALLAAAQTVSLTPNQHKALFLYNFAKYTEWPKEAVVSDDAPFVLGILGQSPFGKDIAILESKTVKGRQLVVRPYASVEDIPKGECQLLFIASSETNKLAQILKAVEKTHILTIAEADGFLQASGMINLLTERKSAGTQTVSFEVNLVAATRANLKLDVQLLKLAKTVLRT